MKNAQQDHRLAAMMSFHPDSASKQDPRYMRNNPKNYLSVQPQQHVYSNLYGDGKVVKPGTNPIINPVAQQQIIVRGQGSMPGGDNPVTPGHPDQIARFEQMEQLGNPRLTSTAAFGASQQRPMGNPRAAIDRGIPGPTPSGRSSRAGRNMGRIGGLPGRQGWST